MDQNSELYKDLDRILLTHEHYDHISGVTLLREKTGGRVLCSRASTP